MKALTPTLCIISNFQVFQKQVRKAKAGDNVGLLLRGVKKEAIHRGMFVCKPNTMTQTDAFTAQLYIQTKQEGGRTKPITRNYINQVCAYSIPQV